MIHAVVAQRHIRDAARCCECRADHRRADSVMFGKAGRREGAGRREERRWRNRRVRVRGALSVRSRGSQRREIVIVPTTAIGGCRRQTSLSEITLPGADTDRRTADIRDAASGGNSRSKQKPERRPRRVRMRCAGGLHRRIDSVDDCRRFRSPPWALAPTANTAANQLIVLQGLWACMPCAPDPR